MIVVFYWTIGVQPFSSLRNMDICRLKDSCIKTLMNFYIKIKDLKQPSFIEKRIGTQNRQKFYQGLQTNWFREIASLFTSKNFMWWQHWKWIPTKRKLLMLQWLVKIQTPQKYSFSYIDSWFTYYQWYKYKFWKNFK